MPQASRSNSGEYKPTFSSIQLKIKIYLKKGLSNRRISKNTNTSLNKAT
jgi:hypothetical protein